MLNRRKTTGGTGGNSRVGFTILELLVVAGIVGVLTGIAMESARNAKIRANVTRSRENLRVLAQGIELYRVDNGSYPIPKPHSPDDPIGVVSASALAGLAQPGSYITAGAFEDPFGAIKVQGSSSRVDMFGFPLPTFNPARSMLYFHYPSFSRLIADPRLDREGYAVISLGPDEKDSFGVYGPFAEALPPRSAEFGIRGILDTVYDPTNGAVSQGDLALFGGDLKTVKPASQP